MNTIIFAILIFASVSTARIISETEPNDDFQHPNLIECGDTVLCASLDTHADFFTFTMYAGDSLYFRTLPCENSENTVILLYDSLFNFLAMNHDGGPQEFSTIAYFPLVSQTAYLQVTELPPPPNGTYNLVYECLHQTAGPHDLCSQARPVSFFPYYDEATTFGAGSEGGTAAPDVYYRLSLATPADIFIRICSEFFDARVQILLGCVTGYMDDSFEGECQLGADLYSYYLQAQDYYIVVEGTSLNQAGDFTIEVYPVLQECPPVPWLTIFSVANAPFLDWPDVPEADLYLIEGALAGEGPFEGIAVSEESFWQDPVGFGVSRRFYRVRSICQ